MRKLLPLLLIVVLLAGCGQATPAGLTDAEMATRVALVLTSMPTATGGAVVEPTKPLPTLSSGTEEMTATPEESVPTQPPATLEPTATPTETELPTLTSLPSATPTASATPLPSPTLPDTDPRLKLGEAKATDPMDKADKWTWPTGDSDFTSVSFKSGKMSLVGLTEDAGWRLPLLPSLQDMYVEMTVATGKCAGKDAYGIIFRVPVLKDADQGYLFSVSCDGQFRLTKWNGKAGDKGTSTILMNWKASNAIITGEGKYNRLGAYVSGNKITLFANGIKLGEATDSTFDKGNFGVFINPDKTKDFTVQIDEISYWDKLK